MSKFQIHYCVAKSRDGPQGMEIGQGKKRKINISGKEGNINYEVTLLFTLDAVGNSVS